MAGNAGNDVQEITLDKLVPEEFIRQQADYVSSAVGDGIAINALSGGVDSSLVTMLGHRALGERQKTRFIDTGLMREDEPRHIVGLFGGLGVEVELVDAQQQFFDALRGLTDPEEKRKAFRQTFYKNVFGELVKGLRAVHPGTTIYLMQGTNYTDVEETVAGVKTQHNILEQMGIDTKKEFGYALVEPIKMLRKSAIRKVAEAIGLPAETYARPPFPGPGLLTRVIGEVPPESVAVVRAATAVVEEEIQEEIEAGHIKPFQYLAILHNDRVTGMREVEPGKMGRNFGMQIEVRCWDSTDAKVATPTKLSYETMSRIEARIRERLAGVVSVTYNMTPKPPSTIEPI